MNKYGCIYKLTNKKNGKTYIGQTIMLDENDIPTERWAKYKYLHCKGQPKLYYALKKYHPDNFSFEVIEYCKNKKEIDCRECYWMGKFDTITKGYNLREGGSRGKHSQESREKISLARKGIKFSKETREKMSLTHKGENNNRYGKKHSQETKEKMSLAGKGRKFSQEHREKLSLATKAYWALKKASK